MHVYYSYLYGYISGVGKVVGEVMVHGLFGPR